MTDGFAVIYYSGKNSIANKATLRFYADRWTLTYTDYFTAETVEVIWKLDQIHPARVLAGVTLFKYGEFPHQSIEYSNDILNVKIRAHYPTVEFDKTDMFIETMNWKRISIVIATVAAFVVCSYLYFIPFLAVQVVQNMPASYDEELGEYVFEQMAEKLEIDSFETVLVNEYAEKINFNTEYPIQIHVVKDATVNAFALPGGHIVVFEGILSKMQHKEELAALLAHEVSHVNHRHSIKAIAKSLSSYLFLSIITSDVNGITSVIVSNADMFNSLTYSRSLEEEADTEGLKVLYDNKIDQRGFIYLFETLQKESDDGIGAIELISTHPLTEDRIAKAKEASAKQKNYQDRQDLGETWDKIKSRLSFQ
ncbi:M48 family metallopeptidase [Cytophaga aurantiaca]|uniref:M48 family metallopeptidase n=1 Tax=Cytophaga aurantiaca TaxID=29530 RepID=UPI00037757D7|nr:M48 family metallopeptidase [Cytophaga aurantiaca]